MVTKATKRKAAEAPPSLSGTCPFPGPDGPWKNRKVEIIKIKTKAKTKKQTNNKTIFHFDTKPNHFLQQYHP